MNNILKRPQTNAICIGAFSAFYTMIFFVTAEHNKFENILYFIKPENSTNSFWVSWSSFLAAGNQKYIAIILVAVTVLVICMLSTRRKSYDEYQMHTLIRCLIVAIMLMLVAIALFFLIVLSEPAGIVEKFMLFIVIHWATVVLADLVYVVSCRWR